MQQFNAAEIGGRIAQARRERGLTQEELAGSGTFSKRSLQDYESGLTIPFRHLRELSQLLDQPVQWFLYGEDADVDVDERLERIETMLGAIAADLNDLRRRLEGEAG